MVNSKVVFITGVGRGIGKALAQDYLARDNHIVIGSVRDAASPKYQELGDSPAGLNSRIILVNIKGTSLDDPKKAVEAAQQAGIDHVDIVIANAGISPPSASLETVPIQDVTEAFQVNVVSPILLFQAVKPLLEKSLKPIWVTVASAAGSITRLERHGAQRVLAYGASKAAADFFTVALHASHPQLIAAAIHPGFVDTDMGSTAAVSLGIPKPPTTVPESSSKIIAYLDKATRETASGKLFDVIANEEIPF